MKALRRMRRKTLAVALLAAILPGSGSSTSQPGGVSASGGQVGAAQGKFDACALVARAEVEALLGAQVKEPQYGMENAGDATTATISECRYDPGSESSAKSATVFVRRSPVNDNTPSAIASVRDTVKEMAGTDPQAVPGVGDTALWGGHRAGLHVFKGSNWYLIISVDGFDDAVALEKAKTLAQKVLDQIDD
jgi:hypothetical protein